MTKKYQAGGPIDAAKVKRFEKEKLKAVQLDLKTKGLYKGRIDGVYGPLTDKAINAYNDSKRGIINMGSLPVVDIPALSMQTEDQINRNKKSGSFKTNYMMVNDATNTAFVMSPEHEIISKMPAVTGKHKGDQFTGKSSREWLANNPGKTFEEYIKYLDDISAKVTPSGVFTVSKKDKAPGEPKGIRGNVKQALYDTGLVDDPTYDIRSKRTTNYGQGLMALTDIGGTGVSQAIHGTANPKRLQALKDPGSDRNMSAGCVNIEGIEYCMSQVPTGAPVIMMSDDGVSTEDVSAVPLLTRGSNAQKKYVKAIYKNKDKLRNTDTSDFQKDIATVVGILQNESKSGTAPSYKAENALDYLGALGPTNSLGPAQIKWSSIKESTRTRLAEMGINSHEDLKDPKKAPLAAYEFLQDLKETAKDDFDVIRQYAGSSAKTLAEAPANVANYYNKIVKTRDRYGVGQQYGGDIVSALGYRDDSPYREAASLNINSSDITMEGVSMPLYGRSNQTGETKLMKPNKKYKFKNTSSVTEVPVYEKGGALESILGAVQGIGPALGPIGMAASGIATLAPLVIDLFTGKDKTVVSASPGKYQTGGTLYPSMRTSAAPQSNTMVAPVPYMGLDTSRLPMNIYQRNIQKMSTPDGYPSTPQMDSTFTADMLKLANNDPDVLKMYYKMAAGADPEKIGKKKSRDRFREKAYGGELQYATGGDVNLSSNAFQVQGDPSTTDSESYMYGNQPIRLDHNEVVKEGVDGAFVFSNKLKEPTTKKSFAKLAATQEDRIKKAEKKMKLNPGDEYSLNTIDMLNKNLAELAGRQEKLATAKGMRDENGYAKQNMKWGGVMKYQGAGPIFDQTSWQQPPQSNMPYMKLDAGKSDVGMFNHELYYSPYDNKVYERQPTTGNYKWLEGSQVRPSELAIAQHLQQYPGPSMGDLRGAMASREFPQWRDAFGSTQPEPTPGLVIPQGGFTPPAGGKPGKRTSTPTLKTQPPSPLDGRDEYETSKLRNYQSMYEQERPGLAPPYAMDTTTFGNPITLGRDLTAAPPFTTDSQSFGQTPDAGAVPTETATSAKPRGPGNFTFGDALQGISALSKFGQLIGGPEKERYNLNNTQITQQTYDPSNALYQNQRAFTNERNRISGIPSINMQRAIGNSLYAQNLSQQNNIVSQYDRMNQDARSQYQDRVSNQRSENIRYIMATDDLNARNRGAYMNAVQGAFDSLSNLGQNFNQKRYSRDALALLAKNYPDVYKSVTQDLYGT